MILLDCILSVGKRLWNVFYEAATDEEMVSVTFKISLHLLRSKKKWLALTVCICSVGLYIGIV